VAHACNPSSGDGDQEDHGSKPAQANSSQDYLKKPFTKIRLVEWLKVEAQSSSSSTTKKKKERKRNMNLNGKTMCPNSTSMLFINSFLPLRII
jgi:hypothetical protein